MSTKKTYKHRDEKRKVEKLDHLTKRTIQITGFGIGIILLVIRIVASLQGQDSGISEFLIAGCFGMGASGSWIKS